MEADDVLDKTHMLDDDVSEEDEDDTELMQVKIENIIFQSLCLVFEFLIYTRNNLISAFQELH